MPFLGPDLDDGILLTWLVQPGERIARGQVIAEVETDKGIIEVECWSDGVFDRILVEPGPHPIPTGTPLAIIDTGASEPVEVARTPSPRVRVQASPLARRMAEHHGIDLGAVAASDSGPVTAADVRGFIDAGSAGRSDGPSTRRAVARTTTRSKREIPHYYLGTRVDLTAMLQRLDAENESRPIARRLLPSVALLEATIRAAQTVPEMNGHWADGDFRPARAVHLGVAVSLRGGGIVAPVIRDADALDVDGLASALRGLVMSARSGRLRGSEMEGATLTVTLLGEKGAEMVFPVIVPPQVAIVGFGRIVDRPIAVRGEVVVAPVVHVSLAGDHRVSDGHVGSRFLRVLAGYIEDRALR